jgi:type I restriction enzyme S subunit
VSVYDTVPVSEIAQILLGGTPSRSKPEFWNGVIKWASAKDVAANDSRYLTKTEETITELGVQNSAAKVLDKGTIVITARGTVGAMAILGEKMAFNQTCYGLIANKKVEPLFFYYALKASLGQLAALSYGTVFDTITMKTFNSLAIPFPPLPIQRRIAEILGRLDDKIEVNRRINRTLEAMAQALFKHWFVDFGPFQAGPFVESQLGLIPEGWRAKPLSSLIKLLGGGTPSTKVSAYWDGDIDWVAAKDVAAASPFIMSTEKRITYLGVQNSSTKILPKFTTIITARGTVGECGLLSHNMAMNQTNYGIQGVGSVGKFTAYLLVEYAVEKLKQLAYGTVFDTITSKTFDSIIVPAPPSEVWIAFEDIICAWFEEMLVSQKETKTLTTTRDYLLPKLLSGEITVG